MYCPAQTVPAERTLHGAAGHGNVGEERLGVGDGVLVCVRGLGSCRGPRVGPAGVHLPTVPPLTTVHRGVVFLVLTLGLHRWHGGRAHHREGQGRARAIRH